MAKFAPVCPPRILQPMPAISAGDYHLLLAHEIVENSGEYRQYFWMGRHDIILDNSVIELGGAVDVKTIMKAAAIVDCMTIVLPDILLDAGGTVASCKAALEEWLPPFENIYGKSSRSHSGSRGFMIVPQGRTIDEFAWCASQFADTQGINFWGVPRNLVAQVGSRKDAIDIVHMLNPNRRIHLLGFSDNLVDDVLCARDRRVTGIDSAVPLRIASLGVEIGFNQQVPARDPKWFSEAQYVPLMADNINKVKQWIRKS